MAEVVMVYPKTGFDVPHVSVDLPLSVLAACTLVEKEFSVAIIDQRVSANWQVDLAIELAKHPLCVGISCMTGPQIGYALEVAKFVKETVKGFIPVVFGGVHSTLFPRQTFSHRYVDYVVIGDGELSFLSLVRDLKRKNGLFCFYGGLVNQPNPETLPDLPYHLIDVEKYVGDQGKMRDKNRRALLFFSSWGCAHRCAYCIEPRLHHGHHRSMSPELAYSRASRLVQDYDLDSIMFWDADFFAHKKRVDRIAELINGNFTWLAQVRMDSVLRMNLDYLYEKGLRTVHAGIESGSPRVLEMLQKDETVSQMLEANRMLAKTNIDVQYTFMMGYPTETWEEVLETVDIVTKLLDENPRAECVGINVFAPYPGTEIYEKSVESGFKPPDTLEGWSKVTYHDFVMPQMKENEAAYRSIMVMSKFVDGTRMLRRLKNDPNVTKFDVFLLRILTKIYRYRWRRHQFGRRFETGLTNWISKRIFGW